MSGLFLWKQISVNLEKNVAEYIDKAGLFDPADNILLAISGGADSTALLHTLSGLKAAGILTGKLLCAHMNHHLRGSESDIDERFVVTQAARLNLKTIVRQLDVMSYSSENKLSIETAARQLRIEALLEIAKANDCKVVLTAHHKNDNAETVLQRLARGTGFTGLAGIWPKKTFGGNITFARPLLVISREQIIEYLKDNNLTWRNDQTNDDCIYRRNFIRHRLLPELQKDSKGCIVEALSRLADGAHGFHNMIHRRAGEIWTEAAQQISGKVSLEVKAFAGQSPAVKIELLRLSLEAIGSGLGNITEKHYQRLIELTDKNISGRKIQLPAGFSVWREYNYLIFAAAKETATAKIKTLLCIKPDVPGQIRFGNYLIEASVIDDTMPNAGRYKAGKTSFVEFFDFDKVKLPLTVRSRRAGDIFMPLGTVEQKKTGKFLTAQRVPKRIRDKTLIVEDSQKVIWLWPIRMCEQAKVTDKTKKILRLQITDTTNKNSI